MDAVVSDAYRRMWADPAVEERIAAGIQAHRTASIAVRVVDGRGRPVPGAVVDAEHVGHAVRFGANAFLLGAYGDGRDTLYEEAFLRLFNAATVAMYWKTLEPEPGALRYAAGSPPVWRRPPPDEVVAWGCRHGLTLNGHTLVWDHPRWSMPAWLPPDPAARAEAIAARIAGLAARYGGRVQRWDVLNERFTRHEPPRFPEVPMPADYDIAAFREAQRRLPPAALLMINEVTGAWEARQEGYIGLIRELLAEGARIDVVGLQFHCFTELEALRMCRDAVRHRPAALLAALDRYQELGRRLHVSEITIPEPVAGAEGEAAQAEMARNLYRLWFSHPAVDAITWWNLADGGAAPGEDGIRSGLIDRQHRPKPAWHALDRLINQEWRTRVSGLSADAAGTASFRGFHGRYRITARGPAGAATVEAASGAGPIAITVPSGAEP